MPFKVPLPAVPKKLHTQPDRLTECTDDNLGLPSFTKQDFTDLTLIGKGSYGKVLKGNRDGNVFVIKELASMSSNSQMLKLFRKEAQLLLSLSGHENVLKIHGFNCINNSMLLEFLTFSFEQISIQHDPVFNLKELLLSCDSLCDFDGFQHLQYFLATDIAKGVAFLHNKGIVHRDLKPDNILVSNRHYENTNDSDVVSYWWTIKPLIAKLTDFGESRSQLIQTKSLAETSTAMLYRGSPVYMAPEALCGEQPSADISDLQQMDIWVLGMVLFHLINPNAMAPYAAELEGGPHKKALEEVKLKMLQGKLPNQLPKYSEIRTTKWKPIVSAFTSCCVFAPAIRPSAEEVVQTLVNSHVNIETLLISQSTVCTSTENEPELSTCELPTLNACSFLSLIIADKILSQKLTTLPKLTQECILTFPNEVNLLRSSDKYYSTDEAYKILKACGRIENRDMTIVIPSIAAKTKADAYTELCSTVTGLLDEVKEEPLCAVYTCPPYTLLICKPHKGQLSIVDTHSIPGKYGGKMTAGVITPIFQESAVSTMTQWLIQRIGQEKIYQELTLLSAHISKQPTALSSESDCLNAKCGIPLSPKENNSENPDKRNEDDAGDVFSLKSSSENCSGQPTNEVEISDHSHRDKCDDDNSLANNLSQNISSNSSEHVTEFSDQLESKTEKHKNRYRKTELNPVQWDMCTPEVVDCLPYDIDGTVIYQVSCTREEMMKKTKDGRPWERWMNSSRSGLNGTRRLAKCKGSLSCPNPFCQYRTNYGCANRVQFEKKNSVAICFTCGTAAELTACPAIKVWEYETHSNAVKVMHKNMHTCVPKKMVVSKGTIREEISKNPGVKPSKLVNDKMVNLMTSNFDWKEVEEVAEKFVEIKQIHNMREQIKREMNPVGENFEALGLYKQKCEERDKFLIYKVNNRALNGDPSFVFKSSKSMAQLALAMDKDESGILKEEYAFFDTKHNRCRGFKTITLWTFHPVMRKIVCLAIMDTEAENTENLTLFWTVFNKMLNEVSGNPDYKFNPTGFVADEHHANWKSIESVFGKTVVNRVVSCEFHFKQSVQRNCRKLAKDADIFTHLSEELLEAVTVDNFEKAYNNMKTFIEKHDQLESWLKWWYDRRTHIFRAFKPEKAPSSNLAEAGHSKLASVGRPFMSLLEAAREDVAVAIRQETELRLFREGIAKGGRGPNQNKRLQKSYQVGMKRAAEYAQELDAAGPSDCGLPKVYVPNTGKHRPPERKKSKGNDNQKPRTSNDSQKQPMQPFHVVFFSMIPNLKKCYGCNKLFTDKFKSEPNDLVLKHFCFRKFRDRYGNNVSSKSLQATYFHLKLDCARKTEPNMELANVIIHDEVKNKLSDGHVDVLGKFGLHL